MDDDTMRTLLNIIREDMRPALGVTEPAAIALASATAARAAGGAVRLVELALDPGVFKNGFSCRIPGTREQGNSLAALVGALAGNPEKGLQVLEGITDADVAEAKTLDKAGAVTVRLLEGLTAIHIEARVTTDSGTGRAVIERRHDNVTLVERDGKVIKNRPVMPPETAASAPAPVEAHTLHDFVAFADAVPAKDIAFVLQAVSMNAKLVKAGRQDKHGAGLGTGAAMEAMKNAGTLPADDAVTAQIALAMAIDARMGGESQSAMTICGSGDHGIICTTPLAALAGRTGASQDRLARAIAVSYLVTMYIKAFAGRLSAFCGCAVAAGTGMAAGAACLMGGDENAVAGTISNMAATLTGMICDGGNLGCALKAVSAAGTGILSAKLALAGVVIPPKSGIVGATVEETMRNIGFIANPGMRAVDDAVISIMRRQSGR